MRAKGWFSILIIATIALATGSCPAEPPFDGTFWQASSPEVKQFYLQGVISGILLGQDRVVRRGLPGVDPAPLAPECQAAVVRMVNALEREVARWDAARLAAALDSFYEEPANRPLGVRWALMAVLLEKGGLPENDRRQP
jgi:hypothetical protein